MFLVKSIVKINCRKKFDRINMIYRIFILPFLMKGKKVSSLFEGVN